MAVGASMVAVVSLWHSVALFALRVGPQKYRVVPYSYMSVFLQVIVGIFPVIVALLWVIAVFLWLNVGILRVFSVCFAGIVVHVKDQPKGGDVL